MLNNPNRQSKSTINILQILDCILSGKTVRYMTINGSFDISAVKVIPKEFSKPKFVYVDECLENNN